MEKRNWCCKEPAPSQNTSMLLETSLLLRFPSSKSEEALARVHLGRLLRLSHLRWCHTSASNCVQDSGWRVSDSQHLASACASILIPTFTGVQTTNTRTKTKDKKNTVFCVCVCAPIHTYIHTYICTYIIHIYIYIPLWTAACMH